MCVTSSVEIFSKTPALILELPSTHLVAMGDDGAQRQLFAPAEHRCYVARILVMMPRTSPKNLMNQISRRDFFTRMAILVGGVAAGLGASMKSAAAKMTQKAALYQDKPKEGAKCATCQHFQSPASCQIVAGKISPNGWCQMYIKKS